MSQYLWLKMFFYLLKLYSEYCNKNGGVSFYLVSTNKIRFNLTGMDEIKLMTLVETDNGWEFA